MSSEQKEKPPSIFGEQIPEDIKGLKRVALDHAMRSMTPQKLEGIGDRILQNEMSKDEYRERQKDNLMWLLIGMAVLYLSQLYPILLQAMGLL